MRATGLLTHAGLIAVSVVALLALVAGTASAQIFHKRSVTDIASKAGGLKTSTPDSSPTPSETETPAGPTFDYKKSLAQVEYAVKREIGNNKADIALRKELDKKNEQWRLSRMLFTLGDFEGAVDLLEGVVKRDRNNWAIRNGQLGELLLKSLYMWKGERATRERMKELKDRWEDFPTAISTIEAMDQRMKDYQRAQQMIDDRIDAFMKSPDAPTAWEIVNLYTESGRGSFVPDARKRRIWMTAFVQWFPEYTSVASGAVESMLATHYREAGEFHKAKKAYVALMEKYKDADLMKGSSGEAVVNALAQCEQMIADYD